MVSKQKKELIAQLFFVGVKGFEPSTPCSQSRCANRTALRPECMSSDFCDAKLRIIFFSCNISAKYLHFLFSYNQNCHQSHYYLYLFSNIL